MIINTFISDSEKIPEYTLLSLERLRILNKHERIMFIALTKKPYERFFDKYNIEFVDQEDAWSDLREEFNGLSTLKRHGRPNTKYPSPNFFFHRAMERIYCVEAVMSQTGFRNVFHFENDVLTYYPLPDMGKESRLLATRMGPMASTFAVTYIPSPGVLTDLCELFNYLLKSGETNLLQYYRMDMINEMSLLSVSNTQSFPILPADSTAMLYDPGSYGQYLGGTNNHDHGKGYAGEHHYIGREILGGKIKPIFEGGKPYVLTSKDKIPLFNLHIHSKNLGAFLC